MGFDDLVQEGNTVIKKNLNHWPDFKSGKSSGHNSEDGFIDYQTYTTWRNKVKKYVMVHDPSNNALLESYFAIFEKDFNPTAFAELMSFLDVNIKRVYIFTGKKKRLETQEDKPNGDTQNHHKVYWPKWGAIAGIISAIIALIVYADKIMEFLKRIFS